MTTTPVNDNERVSGPSEGSASDTKPPGYAGYSGRSEPCPIDGCILFVHGNSTPHRDRSLVEWYSLRGSSSVPIPASEGSAWDLVEPLLDADRCTSRNPVSDLRCVLGLASHGLHRDVKDNHWGELPADIAAEMAAEIKARFISKSPILEAHHLVHGAKRKYYGDPRESFEKLAKLWSVILDQEVTISQVCLCLIQLKVSRELAGHTRDSLVDIAGYAEVLSMALGESS